MPSPRDSDQHSDPTVVRLPSWHIWVGGVLFVLLVQAVSFTQNHLSGVRELPLTPRLAVHQLMFWLSWYAVAPLVFLLARRFPLDRPTVLNVAAHVAAAPVLFALAAILRTLARLPIFGPPRDTLFEAIRFAFSSSLTIFVLLYVLTLLLYYALQYYRAYHSRELRASQLETMVVRAQLDALRNQLQPHFLFNTLHAISALMAKDVGAARRMMTRFSDILRLALDEPDQHEVPLSQELQFIDQYLDLQRLRFG